ncbi:MAG: Na+/H+ antiporter subunit E [Verrucomicrobiota bacterium]|nr:Na+/H+ antiporter subunit E [Limisphaera sp.]MDW8382153.1 Na+/H+ antiporter subunit E [Verrucomicrobiota bacterium]
MSLSYLNVGLALLWVLLTGQATLSALAIGYGMAFMLLALMQPLFPESRYVMRVVAGLKFAGLLSWELLVANVQIARAVLWQRKENLWPNFVTYDVTGLRPGEIFLLSHCISLTPGTTTVEVSDDFRTLVLHVFDARDPEAVRLGIDRRLKEPILAFTRG